MKILRLILGDQLNPNHSWFKKLDDEILYVLMEVKQETNYVLHHAQKILGIFAAMRDFKSALIKENHQVIYLGINEKSNLHSFKANLKNLLLTAKGERVMQPEFGTGLQSLLFEPMDDMFEDKLQDVITQTVSYWLPYINIEQIDVEMTDAMKDRHTAHMTIQFTVGNTIETQEITFTVRG